MKIVGIILLVFIGYALIGFLDDFISIKRANNLSSNTIFPNQSLIIPLSGANREYIVVRGDTLYSIANKFNTKVESIKSLNNLTSNVIYPNQKLLIPR